MKRNARRGAALLMALIIGTILAIAVPIAILGSQQGHRSAQLAQLPGLRRDIRSYVETALDCDKTTATVPAACNDDRVALRNRSDGEISIDIEDDDDDTVTVRGRCKEVVGGIMRLDLEYRRSEQWHLFKEKHPCPLPVAP